MLFRSYGVHACVLIRGDNETSEEAASLADNEVARLLEESNVVIQVRRTNHVLCRKAEILEAQRHEPGQKLRFPTLYSQEDKRGITFLCIFSESHEHEWGRLRPQGLTN